MKQLRIVTQLKFYVDKWGEDSGMDWEFYKIVSPKCNGERRHKKLYASKILSKYNVIAIE